MTPDPHESAVSRFMELWYKVDNLYEAYARALGINFTAIVILDHIRHEACTQKELCSKLMMPKQLINGVIKVFWEKGYVQLKEASDRRNKNIILTDKGRAYADEVLTPLQNAERESWGTLSTEEIEALAVTMEKYEKSFNDALSRLMSRQI